jgi:hypothetical protein
MLALTKKLAAIADNGSREFTLEELRVMYNALVNPCGAFLGYCEARRLQATSAQDSEFWQRLAGSVRKAGTL